MKKPILILLIFAIIIAISIGLVLPSFEKLKNLSLEAQQREKELKDLEDYLSHLQKISLQLKEFAPQLVKIDQGLLPDSYLPSLFTLLQKISAESGISLNEVKISQTGSLKESENIKEREVNFNLSGPYQNFKNFLTSLENSARLIQTTSISFSTKSSKEIPKYNLKIKVYSY